MSINNAEAVQQDIVDILKADAYLSEHDVEAVAENRLDVEALLTAALGSVGICATVLTPAIDYMGQTDTGDPVGEIPELVVSIAESPTNRERPNACTGLDAGIRIARLLHSPTLQLKSIRQATEESRGLIITNVTFVTSLNIALTQEG